MCKGVLRVVFTILIHTLVHRRQTFYETIFKKKDDPARYFRNECATSCTRKLQMKAVQRLKQTIKVIKMCNSYSKH